MGVCWLPAKELAVNWAKKKPGAKAPGREVNASSFTLGCALSRLRFAYFRLRSIALALRLL
jgi:hypothetical protein